MTFTSTVLRSAAFVVGLYATAAAANTGPTGVWIDHTGRGAVEIAECSGGGLCGHVVWVKDAKNVKSCRTQILGNVKPVGANTWDRGWIVDPDDNQRYSVELKPVGADRLRVTGYMGSKIFSETFTWKRAPEDLKRCDGKETATPAAAPSTLPTVIKPIDTPAAQPQAPVSPEQEIAPFGTPSSRPAAPVQREAAAPVVVSPTTVPTEPRTVAPEAPSARVATPQPPPVVETETENEPAPRRGKRQAKASKECKLDLPYVTLKYPCDAF